MVGVPSSPVVVERVIRGKELLLLLLLNLVDPYSLLVLVGRGNAGVNPDFQG